ncbi:hypothetical protein IMY05_004G0115600 [Salix suchowensis]|nr:hypothetical protein IMY05_004G0115600 [Salix suchowensis]
MMVGKRKDQRDFLELFHENTISSTFHLLVPHHLWNIFLCQLRVKTATPHFRFILF